MYPSSSDIAQNSLFRIVVRHLVRQRYERERIRAEVYPLVITCHLNLSDKLNAVRWSVLTFLCACIERCAVINTAEEESDYSPPTHILLHALFLHRLATFAEIKPVK